jgi:hypothetical protein
MERLCALFEVDMNCCVGFNYYKLQPYKHFHGEIGGDMKKFHMIFCFALILYFIVSCQDQTTREEPGITQDQVASADGVTTQTANHEDVSSIDGLVNALYESITFPEGEEPNLERFRSLFIPNAPFIRITPDGPNTMDLTSFVSSFSERIKSNALASFYEAEISRKIHSFGSIAHVFSTYKKGMNTTDPRFLGRGINSIPLFHDGTRWWACGITWEDERDDNPIPEKYLY